MKLTTQNGPDIIPDDTWSLQLNFSESLFDGNTEIVGHVKDRIDADVAPLAVLSTATNHIFVVSDRILQIVIPGHESESWTMSKVYMDFIQTDLAPRKHLRFRLGVTVFQPVTTGLSP